MASSIERPTERAHALVIGASIGGLLTAAVLADHFERVTVLDRDELPDAPVPRRAVPQDQHPHILMGAGLAFLSERFPGIVDEMVAAGATVRAWDALAWHHFGSWRPRVRGGFLILHCSRYFLEWHVRRRVRALPNVTVRASARVTGPRVDARRRRVTGVHVTQDGVPAELAADLVADVSGVGSRAGDWLAAMGYERPPETRIEIKLAYTSRVYTSPSELPTDPSFVALHAEPPHQHRSGFVYALENNRWIVSLNGYFGDHAPTDDEGFLAFARSLPQPHIYERLRGLEPASEVTRYAVPASVRRRFDRLREVPGGLVVLGDAATRFNPIFGQGMTAAALGALALGRALCETASCGDGLARCFYRRHARAMAVPWLLTSSMDLRYPSAVGARSAWLPALNWYTGHLLRLCGQDAEVYGRFLRVLHMMDGLGPVLAPDVVARVLWHAARGAFEAGASREGYRQHPRQSAG